MEFSRQEYCSGVPLPSLKLPATVLQPHLVFSHASHCLPHLCMLTPLLTNKDVQFESYELIWGQNEDCSPGGSISDGSEKPLQSSSVGRSIYKVLVKGEFDTTKHSFYKMFFVSHETLMSPWRDLGQFSHSVMSNFLWPHGLQHARPPCPSLTPGVYSNSCPLHWWCHPTISSVVPFSSHLQSFPASESFRRSQVFTSGGQSIGVSASSSILPTNIQDWFPLGWTGWISLQPKGLSRVFSNTTVQNYQFFGTQLSL